MNEEMLDGEIYLRMKGERGNLPLIFVSLVSSW